MKNVIIPEIATDVEALREALAKHLPSGYKIKIPPLNRKCMRIVKSFGIVAEVYLRPDKIVVHNAMPLYAALATLFCLPFGLYLICKMKEGEMLRSSVHEIVASATRKSDVKRG
jgi:hypothetical protein